MQYKTSCEIIVRGNFQQGNNRVIVISLKFIKA